MITDQNPPTSTVEVIVTHNRLAFFYEPFTPTITINGTRERKPWGTYQFSLPPGDYEVAVSYPWIVSECARAPFAFRWLSVREKGCATAHGLYDFCLGRSG